MRSYLSVIVVLGAILMHSNVHAQCTEKQGTIDMEVWTKAESPYCVTGDIWVTNLRIEPGVRIQFMGNFVFEVHGILTAVGTAQDSIVFTRPSTVSGWKGIYFNWSLDSSELAYCRIDSTTYNGLHIEESNPIIRHCTIAHNFHNAGRITYSGAVNVKGSASLSDCIIRNNTAYAEDRAVTSYTDARGGGIYVEGDLMLKNCIISNNLSYSHQTQWYGDAYCEGGGIFVQGNATLYNCIISNNHAYARDYADRGYAYGGGIYATGELRLANCIFNANQLTDGNASGGGGAYSHRAEVVNCTFAYNASGLACIGDTAYVMNSILYHNAAYQIAGPARVTYSDVQLGFDGIGNIDSPPVFMSTENLKIASISPCVDAGNPDSRYNDRCIPPSFGTTRNDMGAHGGCRGCGWLDEPCICAPDSINVSMCEAGEACTAIPIIKAVVVEVGGASWEDDVLCFTADSSSIYSLTIIATNGFGADTQDVHIRVTIIERPTACFAASPVAGPAPLEVTLSNCSSSETALSYSWDFGDGGSSTEFEPTHTFVNTTPQPVTLIVRNECWADTFRAMIPTPTVLYFEPDPAYLLLPQAKLSSTVSLKIDSVTDVMGVNAIVHYDQTKVKITGYKHGDFLASNGAAITDLSSLDTLQGNLTVSLTAAGGSPAGVSGGGTIMLIECMAINGSPESEMEIVAASIRDTLNRDEAVRTRKGTFEGITSLLGDFDNDLDADFADYTLLVSYWNQSPDDLTGDIASKCSGDPPSPPPWSKTNYPCGSDGRIDFEDQMVFTVMYNWCESQSNPVQYFLREMGTIASPRPISIEIYAPDIVEQAKPFVVSIQARDAIDVIGIQSLITYDGELLHFIRAEISSGSSMQEGLIINFDKVRQGCIEVSRSSLGRTITCDKMLQIDLQFEAMSPGKAFVNVDLIDLRTFTNHSLSIDGTSYQAKKEIAISSDGTSPPAEFVLKQNYPNPFNPMTKIAFGLKKDGPVSLTVYDAAGRLVGVLVNDVLEADYYEEQWDGRNDFGRSVASGVYFYRLQAGAFCETKKMILLR